MDTSKNLENESLKTIKISLKHYISGAFVANAFLWVLYSFLPQKYFEKHAIVQALVYYLFAMVGGAFAGYLISRKTGQGYKKSGIPTGLFSYALYAIVMGIFGIEGSPLTDTPSFVGFILGSVFGARFCEIRRNKKPTR